MKYPKYLIAIAAFCLITTAGLFADSNSKDRGSINLGSAVQIGSTQVAPGDYKVEWSGTGDNVQVNILKGKKCSGHNRRQTG